ncbi:MAG: MFS transporter [Dehalococcoidales bacterium]
MNISEPRKPGLLTFTTRMFSSLTNPAYRIYFFAIIAHFAAMSMQIVSSPLLIFRLTNSTALLGMMSLVSAGPMIAISVFGGAFADRLKKKKILMFGLLGSAVMSLVIALTLATGILNKENPDSWSILFITSAIQGVIMGMMMPALQAIIPEIINRDQLMNAIALNSTGMNFLSLIAPPIAGFVIGDSNFQAVYFIMAGLYVCAGIIASFIPARVKLIPSSKNILADIQKGFGYIRKDALILQILAFTLIIVVLSMPYQQFIPVYVDDILHAGAAGSGILNGVCGGGALVGSLVLMVFPGKKRGLMLLGSGILCGVALTVFSFSAYFAVSLIFIFFIGLAQAFRNTIGSTVLQTYTQDVYMGRVMSLLNVQWGLMSLGTFFVGMLAEVVAVQWILGGMAIILTIVSLFFTIFSPAMRKVD